MDHLAIMNPKWHLIDKILKGEKTIESRWYVNRIAPWGQIKRGEIVYFKDAGKMVTAKATVKDILEQEIDSKREAIALVTRYKKELCFTEQSLQDTRWLDKKRYALLIFLEDPMPVIPFNIDKKGYGSACAWICTDDINRLRK